MGSAKRDRNARSDEQPQHRVRITRPFHLGVYEVTQAEYLRITGEHRSFFSKSGSGKTIVADIDTSRFPAEQIRYGDAVRFCKLLSALPAESKAGRVYRLPTEAEWEYACRAGSQSPFHYGKSLSSKQANFNGKYPYGDARPGRFRARTLRVGSFRPNAFGLYDMHGNVWEWCSDWYAADYYARSPLDDPQGAKTGSSRVIRGGGWYSDARDCRSAFRNAETPDGTFYVMGFRVVMTTTAGAQDKQASNAAKSRPKRTQPATDGSAKPTAQLPLEDGNEWPRWRGPGGNGSWNAPVLPPKWPKGGLKRMWQAPIGGGYGGIAAAGKRVYVMDRVMKPSEQERVLCFDAASGRVLWKHVYDVRYKDLSYGNGPRTTPTVFDGRIYALGAVGHLLCLREKDGGVLWSKDFVTEEKAKIPMWGFAASPVIHRDLVIVHVGIPENGSVVALNRKTGKEMWRSLADPAGYATPVVIQHGGVEQLVCWTPTHIRGLNLKNGRTLWSIPFKVTYGTAIATPIFHRQTVFVSGYWEGSKAIRLGDNPGEAKLHWEDRRNLRGLMSQPLYRDGYAFLLDKRHGLTCFELKTGKKLWDDGNRMTPKGRNPQATMVWIGATDRALVLNSDGELILARLTPKGYAEQSRTKIIGRTWAHPAYAWGCVFARSDTELVCVSLLKAANPRGKR